MGVLGKAFIQLLQITVLPYVAGSLVYGFGSLGAKEARLVFSRGGALLLLLWALTLAFVFLSPLALPSGKGGAFFSAAPQEAEQPIDWVGLYIPANPFYSLANNVVPAVVVFAVLAGSRSWE
jgi:Na+/H+-dicarboxylate symporter